MLEQSVDRVTIRPATLDDAGAIAAIYNHFVRDTIVTFEEIEIDGDEIGRRMQSVWAASRCRTTPVSHCMRRWA